MTRASATPQLPSIDGMLMAPQVIAGEPLDNTSIGLATKDMRRIEALSICGKADDAQVAQTHERFAQVAAQRMPGFRASGPVIITAIANLSQSIHEMREDIRAMASKIDSARARLLNNEVIKNHFASQRPGALPMIVKELEGIGAALPGNHAHMDLPEGNLEIGAVIPRFPASAAEALALGHSQVEILARLYSHDFTIAAGDNLAECVWKFIRFISR